MKNIILTEVMYIIHPNKGRNLSGNESMLGFA